MRIRCGIKRYQGHQYTPCGVYYHLMRAVRCNSTAPVDSQEWRSDDAISTRVVTVREVKAVQRRQYHGPSKSWDQKVEAFPVSEVALLNSFPWKRYGYKPEWVWPEFIPVTYRAPESAPENAIRVWAGWFRYIYMHLKNVQRLYNKVWKL